MKTLALGIAILTLIPMDRLVFRLRQLPQDASRLEVVQLLSKALDIESSAIHVQSLARSTDQWVPSKIATLQFNETVAIQEVLKRKAKENIAESGGEWKVQVEDQENSLVLDTHFRGFTPLCDPTTHDADCIAISGLSSHPFGSWQPKGESKAFMWIRDALQKSLPKIRPSLYGYDTTLPNSNSFQSILDVALGLLNHIKANGWNSPTSKPIVFLAHSLGGIVLKQALVSLANQMRRDDPLRKAVKGAIFFGVPNLGMEQSHLMAVVDGQPNETIVDDLSVGSKYLRQLEEQFAGIAYLQDVQLYWAYETCQSPRLIQNEEGVWERAGKEERLVTPHSATCGLYQVDSRSDSIFPINKNHSNMVKFAENDPDYNIVVDKLVQIIARIENMPAGTSKLDTPTSQSNTTKSKATHSELLRSLDAPRRDFRLEQVEVKFRKTFDWVYDLLKPGFIQWLEEGNGLFWINGKPGSGKSTLMKFIFQDPRTQELLGGCNTSATLIRAAFFFHYRGVDMQRSFEGLLRSVLTQILEQCPQLYEYLPQSINRKPSPSDWTLLLLQQGLFRILGQDEVPFHLCLFLDAVDEYDGRLEPVCKFLKEIAKIPRTETKRIQICFSSRPWDIFTRNFEKNPGFSIQDFTKDDIRDYCLGSIREAHLSPKLNGLVPELVERSKGVFLWLKLVVKDLTCKFKNNTSMEDLETILKSLPTELDEYYAEIIARIPHTHRWKAYAMLELAVRSSSPLPPEVFLRALSSSEPISHPECHQAHEDFWSQLKRDLPEQDMNDFESLVEYHSRTYCGGLIEAVVSGNSHDDRGEEKGIQVFHQTVKDFVLSSKFKYLVLGEDVANITTENGHSFLAKFFFSKQSIKRIADVEPHQRGYLIREGLIYHSRAAEETTGCNMKYFWESIPIESYDLLGVRTSLGLAAYAGLKLAFKEELAKDPEALRKTLEPLLTYTIRSPGRDRMVAMTRLLMEAEFNWEQDPDAFGKLVLQTVKLEDDSLDQSGFYKGAALKASVNKAKIGEIYLESAKILLEYNQSPEVDISVKEGRLGEVRCKPLHICQRPLVEIIIKRVADVNTTNSRGETPLDAQIRRLGDKRGELIFDELFMIACLLVSRGGILQTTSRSTIKRILKEWKDAYGEGRTRGLYQALLPSKITLCKEWARSKFTRDPSR